jgi:copper chaperone CopZ
MKNVSFLIVIVLLMASASSAVAQSAAPRLPKVMTDTLTVTGVCEMCQARIEEAVRYVSGVKFAAWDKETQQLHVVYKTKRTDRQAIGQALAQVGHDSEVKTASDEAYQTLPGCCRYRDGVEVH